MEGVSAKGVLNHLSLLEAQVRSRRTHPEQPSRVKELKAKVEELKRQRDRLKAEIEVNQRLQKLRMSMENNEEEDNEMDDDSENAQLLRLMARHTQLKDLLLAHHLLGGYDVIKTQDKDLCFSLATAYQGTYLDTYNIVIVMNPTLVIKRHNIPPFIPLDNLAKETNMQTNIRAFLDTLSLHLNAFAGRKHQLKLLRERHKSVEVLESNALCSLLVLMVKVSKDKSSLLFLLDYCDHTKCLPTRVNVQCEETDLSDSPQWQKNSSLLMETPVHEALQIMRNMRHIL